MPQQSAETAKRSKETGDRGEQKAIRLLRRWFRSVASTALPAKDGGVDIICSHWEPPSLGRDAAVTFSIQVKAGDSFYDGLRIKTTSFNFWLEHLEYQPLIIFHFPDPTTKSGYPLYVLVLHQWVLENLSKVRNRLQHNSHVFIPHTELIEVTNDGLLRQLLEDEQMRVFGRTPSRLSVRKDSYFRESQFLLDFPLVVHGWEAAELGIGQPGSSEDTIAGKLKIFDLHPVDRAPEERLEQAQMQLYNALLGDESRDDWFLMSQFNTWSVAAARAMASKYEGFLPLLWRILQTWRRRPYSDVLVALQMLAVLGNVDRKAAHHTAIHLQRLIADIRVENFNDFRLVHHGLLAQAELLADHTAAIKAVRLARRFPSFEIQHLRRYGWGFGPHVPKYYERLVQRDTVRATNARDYHVGMKVFAEELLSDFKAKRRK